MNLSKFLNFNHNCPVCEEPLTLYMQWIDSVCFKANLVGENYYEFIPFKGTNKDKITDDCWMDKIMVKDNGQVSNTTIAASSGKLSGELKKNQIYFFYLCNPAGFKDKSWGDYEINLFKGCYYRSTPLVQYKEMYGIETLETINPDHANIINKDEAFSFKYKTKELDRVYMLNLDYESQDTVLWHYTATPEERKQPGFKPNLFEKHLPLLKVRPKLELEEREKLMDRFDGWIIMS